MPTLGTLPSYEHVAQMLAQAQQARGRVVELVFINQSQHHEKMLSVRCAADDSDPVWLFYAQFRDDPAAANSPNQNAPAWSYQSPDVALIHNIVTRECMGGPVEESAQQIPLFPASETIIPVATIWPRHSEMPALGCRRLKLKLKHLCRAI